MVKHERQSLSCIPALETTLILNTEPVSSVSDYNDTGTMSTAFVPETSIPASNGYYEYPTMIKQKSFLNPVSGESKHDQE